MSVDGNICFLAEVLVGIVLRRNQTGLGMRKGGNFIYPMTLCGKFLHGLEAIFLGRRLRMQFPCVDFSGTELAQG